MSSVFPKEGSAGVESRPSAESLSKSERPLKITVIVLSVVCVVVFIAFCTILALLVTKDDGSTTNAEGAKQGGYQEGFTEAVKRGCFGWDQCMDCLNTPTELECIDKALLCEWRYLEGETYGFCTWND